MMVKIFMLMGTLFLGPVWTAHAFFHGMHPVAMLQDPCTSGYVERGAVCANRTIYAGEFTDDSGTLKKIMLPPKHCTNSTTCDGIGEDISGRWGASGSDLVELRNAASNSEKTPFLNLSDYQTAASVAASGTALKFCNDLVFAGYDDWYLPTKSEMAYLFCHSEGVGSSSEAPSCSGGYGGNSSALIGEFFGADGSGFDFYWTSTELNATSAWAQSFQSSGQYARPKTQTNHRIRCVRSFN